MSLTLYLGIYVVICIIFALLLEFISKQEKDLLLGELFFVCLFSFILAPLYILSRLGRIVIKKGEK